MLHRRVGPKQVEYRPRAAAGPESVAVPPERREADCLDEARLAALVELAGRVERHFGAHQDVEWAIDAGGGPLLLQSRPVTAAPAAAAPAPKSAMRW